MTAIVLRIVFVHVTEQEANKYRATVHQVESIETQHTGDSESCQPKDAFSPQKIYTNRRRCFPHASDLCLIAHSYLTSLPLPEDGRLRVPFGLTWKGGSAALRHNLVSWPYDKLGSSWRGRTPALVVGVTQKERANIQNGEAQKFGNLKQKRTIYTTVKPRWECCGELPCSVLSVSSSQTALHRGGTPMTTIAMVTR